MTHDSDWRSKVTITPDWRLSDVLKVDISAESEVISALREWLAAEDIFPLEPVLNMSVTYIGLFDPKHADDIAYWCSHNVG